MIRKLIALSLFFASYDGMVQSYIVNDKVDEIKPGKVMLTKQVFGENVVFIEKKYKLTVDKEDLLKALKVDAEQSGKDFENIYNIVNDYITISDSLTFRYIWTRADDFDNISWFETDKHDTRNLTKKILKETICGLIENGNIEVFQNNKQERNYFFARVDSNYGGNVKGVFTVDKTLIWICPPFMID